MKKSASKVVCIIVAFLFATIPLSGTFAAGSQTATSVCHIGSEYYDTIAEAVTAATDGDTISVMKDSVITSTISVGKEITIAGETDGYKISRSTAIEMFNLNSTAAKLSLQNITIDGGAVWSDNSATATVAQTRTNSGLVVARQAMLSLTDHATLNLLSGAVLQNADSNIPGDLAFGVAINLANSDINMYDGAIIQNVTGNCPVGGNFSAGVCLNEGGTFNMYGGIIRGCAALDTESNSGAAVFIRSSSFATAGTFNMYGTAQTTENYNGGYGSVVIRSSIFNMYGTSIIDHNKGGYGAGVVIYSYALMNMFDHSSVQSNTGSQGAGVYISSSTSDASSRSTLVMNDNSSLLNNVALQYGGGSYIFAGRIDMFDQASIVGNTAAYGGGLFLPRFTGTGSEIANLIGGKISGNSATAKGEAIYFGGTALNLNGAEFEVDKTIFLTGDGTNTNAKVVTLVGAPSTNHYILDTSTATDALEGRDVVRPGSVIAGGVSFSLSDASSYAGLFTHTSKAVVKGADHYGALSDISHDTFLVLDVQTTTPSPTPAVTPTPAPSAGGIPQTGDHNDPTALAIALGLGTLTIIGLGYLLLKQRRTELSER